MSIPAILSGRDINWCPDNEGYHPFCPQPTDPDDYVYCCTYFYLGDDKPSCCRFPLHTGVLAALSICAVLLVLLLLFLYCWCCSGSLLNRKRRSAVGYSPPR